jgi:hypothetical protein
MAHGVGNLVVNSSSRFRPSLLTTGLAALVRHAPVGRSSDTRPHSARLSASVGSGLGRPLALSKLGQCTDSAHWPRVNPFPISNSILFKFQI